MISLYCNQVLLFRVALASLATACLSHGVPGYIRTNIKQFANGQTRVCRLGQYSWSA